VFIAWLAPRGIVAAAVASLFAEQLTNEGLPEGVQLRALVFLVIAVTVLVQGLSGGAIASWLGVRRPTNTGWVIAGANALARTLGATLKKAGEEVVLVDTDPAEVAEASRMRLRALQGNILDDSMMQRTDLESRRGALSLIPNEAVSLLVAQKARRDYRLAHAFVVTAPGEDRETPERVEELGARVLFGVGTDVVAWTGEITRGNAAVHSYRYRGSEELDLRDVASGDSRLPLVLEQKGQATPVSDASRVRTGDIVHFLELDGLAPPEGFEPALEVASTPGAAGTPDA
jgi:hypothetical protein